MPTDKVKEQIRKELPKFEKILVRGHQEKLNESDTSNLVIGMLTDMLGYDRFFDITTEYQIRRHFVDLAIKIEEKPRVFVEVKSICAALAEDDTYQATSYAANEGVNWVILTNAIEWWLYYVTYEPKIRPSLVMAINLLSKEIDASRKRDALYLLSKQSLVKGYLDSLQALGPALVEVMLSETVLEKISRELKSRTGYRVDPGILKNKIQHIMKAEILQEVQPEKPLRERRQRKPGEEKKAA